MTDSDHMWRTSSIVDSVSPTFCLAKWYQTTIYLQTGETHSCYHPAPHAIPLHELKENPASLHNTSKKKLERRQMLEGKKPSGCQYCWKIEALGPSYVSDRHIRNARFYDKQKLEDINTNGWNFDVIPEYVELSFGNECQMRCVYCHPKSSSAWVKEIVEHGTYPTNDHQQLIPITLRKEEANPYVDAFWKWWPTLALNLKVLRITGGEPLLHTGMWKLLDHIDQNPQQHLELQINSNLSIKPMLVDRLIDRSNALKSSNKIKRFELYTSLDTWGAKAEYIRTGLDLAQWGSNFNRFLSNTDMSISLMITVNLLSITGFKSLLVKILEWRSLYNTNKQRIRFDTPHLKEPALFDFRILPKETYLPYLEDCLTFVYDNLEEGNNRKFSQLEYEKIKRIADYFNNSELDQQRQSNSRKNFYNWIQEHDRRNNKLFTSVFPEMIDFWNLCKDQ
jgi:organic radical activating enzyme